MKTIVFYIISVSFGELIMSIQAISIDPLVDIIISCLVLCFLLRYAGALSSRDRRLRKRMLVWIRREDDGLKLIANKAFYPQATYWSNVNDERFHKPH